MTEASLYFRARALKCGAWIWVIILCSGMVGVNEVTLTGRIELQNRGESDKAPEATSTVVWLTPVGDAPDSLTTTGRFLQHPRLMQKNKSFDPHILVVPVGSVVEFPNRDPFFHNVFSLFEGKRFDLGLYEAGSTRNVHFDKPGISYIFCNIHPEMSAVVIALDTPYYAVSNGHGELVIPGVPAGRYLLRVWSEASLPENLRGMAREITVSESTPSLGIIRLTGTDLPHTHKNKYGQDYEPPAPASPVYERP